MLVLTRKHQERIRIGENIVLTVLRIKGNTVRVGIEAPREVRVVRGELPPKDELPAPSTVAPSIVALGGENSGEAECHDSPSSESTANAEEQPAEANVLRRLVRQRKQPPTVTHAI